MKSHKSLPETFFILTPEVREKLLTANLTAAEWRLWCYLVSLDPFGDRGAKFLPAELMLKCQVKKSTYFAAKAKFQKLGFFDFKDGVTKVVNLQGHQTQGKNSANSQQDKIIESKISESKSKISESKSKISESKSKISENQLLEPLSEEAFNSSQTLQTYSDFIKTLSESERENFLNFVRKQIQNLPTPVNDIEAWLANLNSAEQNRWEIYYQKFQASLITKSQDPQKRPVENNIQQQARKFREELEERKRAARELREKEQEGNNEAIDLDKILADYDRNKRGQLPKPPKNSRFPHRDLKNDD